jgi:hypothetical protein
MYQCLIPTNMLLTRPMWFDSAIPRSEQRRNDFRKVSPQTLSYWKRNKKVSKKESRNAPLSATARPPDKRGNMPFGYSTILRTPGIRLIAVLCFASVSIEFTSKQKGKASKLFSFGIIVCRCQSNIEQVKAIQKKIQWVQERHNWVQRIQPFWQTC